MKYLFVDDARLFGKKFISLHSIVTYQKVNKSKNDLNMEQYKRELLMNKRYIDCIGLAHRIKQEVPEMGDFEKVKERFEFQSQQLGMAKGWLEVYQPPVGVEGREWMRALDLVVYKDGSAYVCRRMLECGTKQDILDILNDEGIIDTITSAVPVMLDKL